jgi:NAD(P)H-hydrate epimerase
MDDLASIAQPELPWITAAAMREIDRVMIEDLGILLLQMMENAGRALARVATAYGAAGAGATVCVLAGTGGNGGGGLVAARHLANWSNAVAVVLSQPRDRYQGVPAHQLAILDAMGVVVIDAADDSVESTVRSADVALDALVGYSLSGPLRGASAELVGLIERRGGPVVSLDLPSGCDADTGPTTGPVVRPDATVTLCLPKRGLAAACGPLYLADISVPPAAVERVTGWAGAATLFERGPLLRLDRPGATT